MYFRIQEWRRPLHTAIESIEINNKISRDIETNQSFEALLLIYDL
jgi:hypothetical protein